jgi:hypothetical protein
MNTTGGASQDIDLPPMTLSTIAYQLALTAVESVCLVLISISPLSTLTFCRVGGYHGPIHIDSQEKQSHV